MQTWIIEPYDPLIVRDGRPFGPEPGARARSLAFPFPSTTTGGLRGRAGLDSDSRFDRGQIDAVKQIAVRGPLLVALDDHGEIAEWLAPAPADALLLKDDYGVIERQQIAPLALPSGAANNLPGGLDLLGPQRYRRVKPLPQHEAPQFWHGETMRAWLEAPQDGIITELAKLGVAGPGEDRRTHVRITSNAQTAMEGFLFQTSGREFFSPTYRLGIAIVSERNLEQNVAGFAPLGGERRLMRWRLSAKELPPRPDNLIEMIVQQGHCRLILLTPAVFITPHLPGWLLEPRDGVRPQLQAALVSRSQVVSGWDLAAPRTNRRGETVYGAPKPTRRLAPAGSVFFLRLEGEPDAVRQWVRDHWMFAVSDAAQDRHDGFGLAVFGTWSGIRWPLEVEPHA